MDSNMPAQPKQSLMIGSIFIVLAFLANTIQSVFGKAIESEVSVEMFSWVTFLSALVVVTIIVALRRFRDLKTTVLPMHLLRGGTGISGFLLFIGAAQATSLMNANVLLNTTPIFIPLLAMAFLHNRINRQLWLAIAMGFAGMVIIVKPSATIFTDPGNLLGLLAGFVTAIEFLAVKKLDESDSPLTQMFYFLLIGTVICSFLVAGKFQAITASHMLIMLATGICLVLFQFLLIKAYMYAKPHEIGAFQYSSVVFAAILGWVVFKESLDAATIAGTTLVCIGGYLSISGRKENGDEETAKTAKDEIAHRV
jgi:drug/metabolite transporter (DMT)-like permease